MKLTKEIFLFANTQCFPKNFVSNKQKTMILPEENFINNYQKYKQTYKQVAEDFE